MKLYSVVIPVLMVLTFVYGNHVLDTVAEKGPITKEAVLDHVKHDLDKFEPSTEFVYNK